MSNSPTEPMARPMTVSWEDECRARRVVLSLRNKAREYQNCDKPDMAEGKREEADAVERIITIARAESPALTEGVEAVAWRARYAVGKNVDTWSLHETEPKWLTSDGSGDYEVQPLYATPLQTGARGGLGSLRASPSVPTEGHEAAVLADALTERLTKVAYATEFLDVREDILALIERDRTRWLDNIAVCELLAKARAQLADCPSGAPDRPRR